LRLKERISVATFNGRQGKESFAQKIFSGEEVERLVESIEKGNDTEQQRDRRQHSTGWTEDDWTEDQVRNIFEGFLTALREERERQRSTTPSSLPRCSDRGDSMSMYCRED